MTNFSITLVGYKPSPRYPPTVTPWTRAQISYSPDNGVQTPYVVIDIIVLPNPDADPRYPAIRNLTTLLSPAATGWFLVTFLDAAGNQEPTDPVQFPAAQGGGSASPSVISARYGVRQQIRDGLPALDADPMPFSMVRLESLTDQIGTPATPVLQVFQCRYEGVPTQDFISVQVIPGTLAAYVDGSWTAAVPLTDVDQNGNFTLPVPPTTQLLVTYGWQYFSDSAIDSFVDEARQWLREFKTVDLIPDGLVPALIDYASSKALYALGRAAILAPIKAGDSEVDWSKLAGSYNTAAKAAEATALRERQDYYTQGPEAKDPMAVDVAAPYIERYEPWQ